MVEMAVCLPGATLSGTVGVSLVGPQSHAYSRATPTQEYVAVSIVMTSGAVRWRSLRSDSECMSVFSVFLREATCYNL